MLTAAENTDSIHHHVEHAARQRLANAGYRPLTTVECSFRDGRMMLRGAVPSYFHKQLAQESVRDAPHVTQIVNQIEVLS